jgi:hypothetical protein
MKSGSKIFIVLFLITCLIPTLSCLKHKSSSGNDKGKVNLTLKLKEGMTYNQLMTMEQSVSTEMMGAKQDIKQTMEFLLAMKVEKVDPNGDMMIDCSYKSIKFKQEIPMMGVMEFDSTKNQTDSNPIAKLFSMMVGKSIKVVLSPEGKAKEIKGFDNLISGIMDAAEAKEGPERKMMEETFEKTFNDESFGDMVKNFAGMLPGKPISIGESWTSTTELSKFMPVIMTQTNTLKEIKEGKAIVGIMSTIKPNPDSKPLEMGPMKMTYEMTGEQKGDIEIDLKTGLTVGGEINQDISGKIVMEGIPSEPEKETAKTEKPKDDTGNKETKAEKSEEQKSPVGMTIPMTIKSIIKIKKV